MQSPTGSVYTASVSRGGSSLTDRCSAVAGGVLVVASLAYLWTDLTYDEAVYLQLARKITETGLPWRRTYPNFDEFRLFANSPPLVLYTASVSQMVFPGNEIPARLVHFLAFAAPTYLLVWWVARSRFGPWAGCASLIALVTTGSYVRDTTNVLLNIPLGLFACVALVAFDQASTSRLDRRRWLAALAVALGLAIWTKYQAVVIAGAFALYAAYVVRVRGFTGFRPLLPPLAAAFASGALASIALLGYFWASSGRDGIASVLAANATRMDPTGMSPGQIVGALMETVRECERTLGGIALLLGAAAIWIEPRHRGLLVLLTCYVGATIAFNLAVFRLPGAGSSYLDSAVPALALLIGPAAVRFVRLGTTPLNHLLLATAATVVQLSDSPATFYDFPKPNGSRVAAAYIAATSTPDEGIVADTVAVEFYTGRPVRPAPFTDSTVVLRSLAGTTTDQVSFVIVSDGPTHRNLKMIQTEWNALLAQHFELVPIEAPGLTVYQRRSRTRAGSRQD